MEEITTRFEIVRLAVKMADHETVSVQAKKLRDLSLDEDLNEIISLLESKNYRQALYLMKGYVNSLDDSFFNEPSAAPVPKKRKAQQVAEAQNLFDMMQSQPNKTINLDDMLRMTEESAGETVTHHEPARAAETYITQAKKEVEKNEAYLDRYKNRAENKTMKPFEESKEELLSDMEGKVIAASVVSEPMEEHVSELKPPVEPELPEPKEPESVSEVVKESMEEEVPETVPEEKASEIATEVIENINEVHERFAETEMVEDIAAEAKNPEAEILSAETPSLDIAEDADVPTEEAAHTEAVSADQAPIQNPMPEAAPLSVSPIVKEVDIPEKHRLALEENKAELKAKRKEDYTKENRRYPPISYIDQKFRNMRHQFPQVEEDEGAIIDEVKVLLKQVATEGYTENDIRDAILFFQEKKAEGHKAEAAQMLLLAAASESKYAQLLLARELFKGEVLKVDYPESFTQINRLAEHDYPEAICDLAQLYEYGYGIKKDKKTAQLLYEEAAEMGVERAQKHAERFSRKKGILSSFFK